MSFLDNISKKITEGVERAKFEAEKLQRVVALQSELGDLRKQMDGKRLEFGDRALDLYKAGKIQSPTLGEILRAMEQLQVGITLKEEELKLAQGVPAPAADASPGAQQAQNVPINVEPPRQQPPAYTPPAQTYTPPPAQAQPAPGGQKTCPTCGFQMPGSAVFCPNCGLRVSA